MLGFYAVSTAPLSTLSTTNISVQPLTGTLSLSSVAPILSNTLIQSTGSLSFAGYAPAASRSDTQTIGLAALALSTYTPAALIGLASADFSTAVRLTTYAPDVRFGATARNQPSAATKDLMPFILQKQGATWIDVNSRYSQNKNPLLVTNVRAINNSLFNLFQCPIGSRGRIMQPTYGTFIYQLLQEPIDQITAQKIRASLIQSIERWEPRIQLDYAHTFILPDMARVGYKVQVKYNYIATGEPVVADFFVAA